MSQPYVGEMRIFAGDFAPAGWAFCDGSELPVADYEALFALIGTTYGGDGQATFRLPDLRGRLPVHQASDFLLGQAGGAESVTLSAEHVPVHSHPFLASRDRATAATPGANVVGQPAAATLYAEDRAGVALAPQSLQPAAGGQPHDNVQPYLAVSFIIALSGVFPSAW